ncbi:HmuY family protein [Ornithobacterium rhinotracheale]
MKKSILAIAGALVMFSCSSSDDDNGKKVVDGNAGVVEVQTSAKSYDKWTYYSIEQGKEVAIENPKESLAWDIAFHRGDVKLNGGASGKGKGEAIKLTTTDFATVTEAPAEGYVKDVKANILSYNIKTHQMTPLEDGSKNEQLFWLNIDTNTPPPKYTLYKNVFVIKTASGKYAKIQFLNYIGDNKEKIVATWKYFYQANGSRKLVK